MIALANAQALTDKVNARLEANKALEVVRHPLHPKKHQVIHAESVAGVQRELPPEVRDICTHAVDLYLRNFDLGAQLAKELFPRIKDRAWMKKNEGILLEANLLVDVVNAHITKDFIETLQSLRVEGEPRYSDEQVYAMVGKTCRITLNAYESVMGHKPRIQPQVTDMDEKDRTIEGIMRAITRNYTPGIDGIFAFALCGVLFSRYC